MKIFGSWLLGLLTAAMLFVAPASAEKRVALVVGNGAYKNAIDLPNPPNDAREVANALRRLGFLVIEGLDLTYGGMQDKMREYARALVSADIGLFYYAGHGIQVAGENYLVPIDAALKRESDLEFEAVKVDVVLRQLSREAKIKVVILDSCRDNPLAAELARSMASNSLSRSRSTTVSAGMGAMDIQSVTGTMIAFSTAPGTVALDGTGRHSPFTEALLANIETPNLDIDLMMKRVRGQVVRSTNDRQQPWTNSSLTAEYFLNGQGGTAGQQVAALPSSGSTDASTAGGQNRAASAAFDPRQMEFELWRAAQSSNTVNDFNAYLQQYPNGTFADIARSRVAALQSGGSTSAPKSASGPAGASTGDIRTAAATEATEDALDLSTNQWRDAQKKLTALGFSTKGTDGRVGAGTRQALKDWQSSKQFPSTGYLNEPQFQALMSEVGSARSTSANEDEKPNRKTASRSRDDDEEEAKPRRRSYSSSQNEDAPRQRRNNSGSGGGQSVSPSSAGAVLGTVLAIGAGVAIGRAIRRR